jgi:uncharacterized protein YqeY
MKQPEAQWENFEMPKLCKEVRRKNGKSGKKLMGELDKQLKEYNGKHVDDNSRPGSTEPK